MKINKSQLGKGIVSFNCDYVYDEFGEPFFLIDIVINNKATKEDVDFIKESSKQRIHVAREKYGNGLPVFTELICLPDDNNEFEYVSKILDDPEFFDNIFYDNINLIRE